MSAGVDLETHSRWKAASTRNTIAGLFVLAYAGVAVFGLTRQGKDQPPPLPQVILMPASVPSGLTHVGTSRHGSDDEHFLKQEAHFGRRAAVLQASKGPGYDAMTVATTSYRVGLIDPNLEGRLSGEVYAQVRVKPGVRGLIVRGHDGVLEVFPQRSGGSQLRVLTWIERPGVYIQIHGVDLSERQLLKAANSLREQ